MDAGMLSLSMVGVGAGGAVAAHTLDGDDGAIAFGAGTLVAFGGLFAAGRNRVETVNGLRVDLPELKRLAQSEGATASAREAFDVARKAVRWQSGALFVAAAGVGLALGGVWEAVGS